MQSYLVETYLPCSQEIAARAAAGRMREAAEAMSREGTPAHFVRTTFLPDDETCFHLVQSGSLEAARELTRRAGLGHVRIVPAIEASRSMRPPAR